MRQILLDTETTGMDPTEGHRIIEIGCVELVRRRLTGNNFHEYLNPDRAVDEGAENVHGLSNRFLADKPRFADIARRFVDYVQDAELIIHNAPFDVGFIDAELARLGPAWGQLEDYCTITDSLQMARRMHPGQRCSLDALCKRYSVDGSRRELHGALLDSELLAEVYLAMTGGQGKLSLEGEGLEPGGAEPVQRLSAERPRLRVPEPGELEREAHEQLLQRIEATCGGPALWRGSARGEEASGS
ncbi:DNA polymerase III subunit epsilon [Halorhodospira halophila]|uniref:DNA polymerase III subunit epsilon n=1 Tax=Halorhodospira halophila (strain DSM 244 / SL1) TaxID=349124 RepID=A1WTP4_HALHL|nr:DNA polymerase III subunit epsilon [Halorhodospira halophila]ABM61056.1 DNA polymerase III, epsilon subunit [Halorhodospira halophila SL1]MBK1729773.1 DNA polymerase III subunit epsilon [Halorhodospira halophila]